MRTSGALPSRYARPVGKRTSTVMLLVPVMMSACDPNPRDTHIDTRLRSPDGKLEAVFAEDLGGGPATGTSMDVYVVTPGRFPRLVDRVFSNECVQNVHLNWLNARTLQVSYTVGADVHESTVRATPNVWWAPWLWGHSPSSSVALTLRRTILPAGNGC